jgi:hypothetical protein
MARLIIYIPEFDSDTALFFFIEETAGNFAIFPLVEKL